MTFTKMTDISTKKSASNPIRVLALFLQMSLKSLIPITPSFKALTTLSGPKPQHIPPQVQSQQTNL